MPLPKKFLQRWWCHIIVIKLNFVLEVIQYVVEYLTKIWRNMFVALLTKRITVIAKTSMMAGTRSIFAVKTKYESHSFFLFTFCMCYLDIESRISRIEFRVPSFKKRITHLSKKKSLAPWFFHSGPTIDFFFFTDDRKAGGSIKENNKENR